MKDLDKPDPDAAVAYVVLGDLNAAFETLEAAISEHDESIYTSLRELPGSSHSGRTHATMSWSPSWSRKRFIRLSICRWLHWAPSGNDVLSCLVRYDPHSSHHFCLVPIADSRRLPDIDWNALCHVSCSALLGGRPTAWGKPADLDGIVGCKAQNGGSERSATRAGRPPLR